MPATFPRVAENILHAQAEKCSGKQPLTQPFFYGAEADPAAFFHAAARFHASMGYDMSVKDGMSCRTVFPLLPVCLNCALFSTADVE